MTEVLRIDAEPKLEPDQILAFRALARGQASYAQQRWAFQKILEMSGASAIEPAKLSERESGFLAGKRHTAMLLLRWANMKLYETFEQEDTDV